MRKKTGHQKDVLESLQFLIERTLTKDDVRQVVHEEVGKVEKRLEKKIDEAKKELIVKIEGVDNKINGTNRRLDSEAIQRTDLKLPRRMHDVEMELFGASKHPKELPF